MSDAAGWWAEVDALRAEAERLDPAGRAALLDERCVGRPRLREQVEAQLLASVEGGAPPDDPDATGADHASTADRLPPGTIVGGYLLHDRLGEGGMGRVFRATRADERFAQTVAVKVMRAALDDPEAVRRFKAERQILASLSHPHIVSLVDGGITPAGQAYLVMELVDGVPIAEDCRRRGLGLPARLELMRQVCSAVHYAHRHGIVHRDLKPANILVTREGVPKVVDFGIAKLLSPDPAIGQTVTGMLPTPGQARWRETVAAAEFTVALAAATADRIAAWQRVRDVYDALLDERPDDPTRLRNAALAAKYLGGALDFEGQTAAALEQYRRALALDERQLLLQPDSEQARFDLAIDLSNVAGGLMQLGDPAAAASWYERSVALREAMATADPSDQRARDRLLVARIKLAYCYARLGRRPDANRLVALAEPDLADPPGRAVESWRLIERARVQALRAELAPIARRCTHWRAAAAIWDSVAARGALDGANAAMQRDVMNALAACTTPRPAP